MPVRQQQHQRCHADGQTEDANNVVYTKDNNVYSNRDVVQVYKEVCLY